MSTHPTAGKPPNLKGDYCRVHIRVRCDTDFGQSVAVSGSVFALGNGSKDKVVHLATDPESHPIWYTTTPIVISRTTSKVNYRYCLIEGGVAKAFERADNWRGFIPASYHDLDIIFEDTFSLINLEGFGHDSELEVYEQMQRLAKNSTKSKPESPPVTTINISSDVVETEQTGTVSENLVSKVSTNWLDELDNAAKSFDALESASPTAATTVPPPLPIGEAASPAEAQSPIAATPASATPAAAVPEKRLYLVCYHLPVRVRRVENPVNPEELFEVTWAESIIANSEAHSVAHQMPTTWIGTLNLSVMDLSEMEQIYLLQKLQDMDCIPMFIDNDLTNAAYYGYCKTILWPTFHNVDQLDHIHAAWNLQDDYRHSLSSTAQLRNLAGGSTRSNAAAGIGPIITPITSTPIGSPKFGKKGFNAEAKAALTDAQGPPMPNTATLAAPIVPPPRAPAAPNMSSTLTTTATATASGDNSGNNSDSNMQQQQQSNVGFRSRSTSAVALAENRVLEWNVMEEDSFAAFQEVNRKFADLLLQHIELHNGDVVWVHDYHLMLLPQMLREGLSAAGIAVEHQGPNVPTSVRGITSEVSRSLSLSPAAAGRGSKRNMSNDSQQQRLHVEVEVNIVFFLHIPFPTSQIFRTLPKAYELVSSLICADVLGFHAFDHARHFLNTAKRMLGYRSVSRPGGMLTLSLPDQDREVVVNVSHVSVEVHHINALANEVTTTTTTTPAAATTTATSTATDGAATAGTRLVAEEKKSDDTVRDDTVDALCKDPKALTDIMRMAQQIRNKYSGRKIIAGVDVGQRLSGVALKLAAFDNMLTRSSYGIDGNVVLIQRSKVGCGRPGDEETTSTDIKKMVVDINEKHRARRSDPNNRRRHSHIQPTAAATDSGSADTADAGADPSDSVWSEVPGTDEHATALHSTALRTAAAAAISAGQRASSAATGVEVEVVVDYEEVGRSGLRLKERLALWLAADVLLITPIREGLNLMPLEYIFVRRALPHAGAVIASEFSTCAALLNGAIKVNPFAPGLVADSIEKALSMSARESDYRRQRDLGFITSHPAAQWTKQIIADLVQLRSNSGRARTNPLQFPKSLDWAALRDGYETAAIERGICETGSRVLIFDYGGTLLHKEKNDIYMKRKALSAISGRKPSNVVMRCIEQLSNDPLNIVMVVTGLTQLKLGDTFYGMPNITLATSNGLVYSWGRNLQESIRQQATQKRQSLRLAKDGLKLARSYSSGSNGSGSEEFESASLEDRLTPPVHPASSPLTTTTAGAGGATAVVAGMAGIGNGAAGAVTATDSPVDPGKPPLFRPSSSSATAVLPTKSNSNSVHMKSTHGASPTNPPQDPRIWGFMDFPNLDWRAVLEVATPIIQKFTFRTNGTCMTPRWPGVGWSYFGADPDWGQAQAAQLKLELEASLARMDVQVTSLIQGSIEVVPRALHKGAMVTNLLARVQAMRGGRLPGFLLVLGDEESDDKMTLAAQDTLAAVGAQAEMRRCKTFTVNVGKRVCPSRYFVNDVDDVEELLHMLAQSDTTRPPEPEMVQFVESAAAAVALVQ